MFTFVAGIVVGYFVGSYKTFAEAIARKFKKKVEAELKDLAKD